MSATSCDRCRFALGLPPHHASDKRLTAIHEAAHAVVALANGSTYVRAWIWKNPTDKPLEEKTWLGSCSHGNPCPEARAIIGIAGELAEAIERNEWDENWGADFCEWEMSDTDRECLGDYDPGWAADKAHEIIASQWHNVEAIACALINDECLTDWQISQLVTEGTACGTK
jgi:hypothetical protein